MAYIPKFNLIIFENSFSPFGPVFLTFCKITLFFNKKFNFSKIFKILHMHDLYKPIPPKNI